MALSSLLALLACTAPAPPKHASPGTDSTALTGDSSSNNADSAGESATDSSHDTAPWTLPPRPDTDSPAASDSWRWGGGVGYPDVVDPTWPVVVEATDATTLAVALAAAGAGDIVFIPSDAEIDLTGQSLCIPAGVWLAGDRGVDSSPGGLITSSTGAASAILTACGDDVRVTGLRIRGPDPETCPAEWPDNCPNDVSADSNCAYCTDTAYGISTTFDRLEVDNNELSGWTYAAVGVKDALDADVHHNWIHNNWREGLGYGTVLYGSDPTSAVIRWNRYDGMRHAVAGQGYPSEDYEARDNLVEADAISHVFDMHGENEAAGDGTSYAGGTILVHDNIVLVPDQHSFVVRGEPDDGAWFYANCVAPSDSEAAQQWYYYGNFHVGTDQAGASFPDAYDQSAGDCGTVRWCLADAAVGPLHYGSASGTGVADLLVGDFDGDGKADVFGSSGTAWRWANPNGGTWTTLATSTTPPSDLAIADLDGDGISDVFHATGTAWQWSKSGTGSWATLRSSTTTLANLAFGDFDGDGKADVFTTDGSRWSYYPGGSGAPVSLAASGEAITSLRFGDFDGDGITDVFDATGSQWRWSRSGTASWANLAANSDTVADLGFADLNGDGRTDVIDVSRDALRVSWSGTSSWQTLRYQVAGLSDVLFGDFDGDKRADVLVGGCL